MHLPTQLLLARQLPTLPVCPAQASAGKSNQLAFVYVKPT